MAGRDTLTHLSQGQEQHLLASTLLLVLHSSHTLLISSSSSCSCTRGSQPCHLEHPWAMVAILQGWHHDHGSSSSSRQAILMQLYKETRGKVEEVKAGISDCRHTDCRLAGKFFLDACFRLRMLHCCFGTARCLTSS